MGSAAAKCGRIKAIIPPQATDQKTSVGVFRSLPESQSMKFGEIRPAENHLSKKIKNDEFTSL
jgi:hypothetical protein